MAGSVTVAGRSLVTTGTATITSFTQATAPALGAVSIHDCALPTQAELTNCVWPTDYVNPGGFKYGLPSPVGIVCMQGVVVHTKSAADGSFTIGWH